MARSGPKRGDDTTGRPARTSIIDATIATLAEQGYSGTSARAVAQTAGIAPGGVFYHFGSMDQLMMEAFDVCNTGRVERLRTALDQPTAAIPATLAELARQEFALPESRAMLEIVVGAMGAPTLAEHVRVGIDTSLEFTRDAIVAAAGDGPLADAIPVDLVAELAASAFFGLEILDHVGRRVDLDALARLITLVTAMLGSSGLLPDTEG